MVTKGAAVEAMRGHGTASADCGTAGFDRAVDDVVCERASHSPESPEKCTDGRRACGLTWWGIRRSPGLDARRVTRTARGTSLALVGRQLELDARVNEKGSTEGREDVEGSTFAFVLAVPPGNAISRTTERNLYGWGVRHATLYFYPTFALASTLGQSYYNLTTFSDNR